MELVGAELGFVPSSRVETTSTLVEKLRRNGGHTLRSIHDLGGMRLVVPGGRADQDRVVEQIYDRGSGTRLRNAQFETSAEALGARFAAEAEYDTQPGIEVLAVSAASEAELRKSHGRYVLTSEQLGERLVGAQSSHSLSCGVSDSAVQRTAV